MYHTSLVDAASKANQVLVRNSIKISHLLNQFICISSPKSQLPKQDNFIKARTLRLILFPNVSWDDCFAAIVYRKMTGVTQIFTTLVVPIKFAWNQSTTISDVDQPIQVIAEFDLLFDP